MKVSFILLRLFHDKDCKVTSFLAGSSRPLLICCLWKDLQRATMSSPNSWIRGETPRAARANLRGTPVADVDPRKTHLTRTSLRNERKRALTRVTPSGATSCSEIRKGGGTCLTVHLRDSWPRYRCTVMCRPPASQQVSAGSWLKFTVSPPALFEWQLCRNWASDCGSCRETPTLPLLPPPPLSPAPLTKDSDISNNVGQTTLHSEPRESLCWGWTELFVRPRARVCVCVCVWHTMSSREFHFTQRLSVRNSLHCLLRGALIKPLAGPRRTINQSVFKIPRKKCYARDCLSCNKIANEFRTAC